jgi:uncharacterized membrane protein
MYGLSTDGQQEREDRMSLTHERIGRLEELVADLDSRVALLEGRPVRAPRPAAPARPAPQPAAPRPARPQPVLPRLDWGDPRFRFDLNRDDLEDLVGGRVLAWVGGLTVLLGLVFLFALAISSGWIGETARVLLGGAGSAGLLALGVWLHEEKARTDAALAATATGIAGLFVTLTVAAQVYELVPQLLAVGLAVAVGVVATGLALRWESRGIAGLGILGGLAAPYLAGAAGDGGTMLIVFVALASSAAVLLWQRWDWLALAAFAVATPQWVTYVVNGASTLEELAVLIGFAGLGVVVAVGHDVRIAAKRLRASSAYLLALNAIVVSAAGWLAISSAYPNDAEAWFPNMAAGNAWLAGVAAVHIAVGLLGPRMLRLSNDVRLLALAIGVLVGDVAFGLIADGPVVLALGWAVTGVAFAGLVRRVSAADTGDTVAAALTHAGLGGHLALSLLSSIAVSHPDRVLAGSEALSLAGGTAIVALSAACLISARLVGERDAVWKLVLDSTGLISVAVLTAMNLDGLQLALAWTAEAVVLGAIARRSDDPAAAWGALGFLALAALHAVSVEAPPVSLVTGLADPAAAVAALAAVAAAALTLAGWLTEEDAEAATVLRAAAALTLLYLASAAVVTPFESDAAVDSALLSAHQQGQMVLSVFWGVVGVGTIVVGLRRDLTAVRIAGLALVGVTVTKLFLFDLATLTAGYRVVSFIGLGLLLLGGALVWQRLRPRALSDLRETPAGVR